MARKINPAEADDWSVEELERNLKYLRDRSKMSEVDEILKNLTKAVKDGGKSEEEAPEEPEEGTPEWVRKSNIETVLTWVGEDADRAQVAYDAEQASEKPRKTLVEELESNFEFDET